MATKCSACEHMKRETCQGVRCPFYRDFPPGRAEIFRTLEQFFGEDQLRKVVTSTTMTAKEISSGLKKLLTEARAHESLQKAMVKAAQASHARNILSSSKQLGLEISDSHTERYFRLLNELLLTMFPNMVVRITRTQPVVTAQQENETVTGIRRKRAFKAMLSSFSCVFYILVMKNMF